MNLLDTQTKFIDFEDWLKDNYEPDGVLDDDLSDSFDNWLGSLDGEEYIEYADEYGKEMFLRGQKVGIVQGGEIATSAITQKSHN